MVKNKRFSFTILFTKVLITSILLTFISFGCDKNQIKPEDNNQKIPDPGHKKWTFMFYDDADFFMAFDPLDALRRSMFSGENVNVLVLQDKEKGPASLWYIDENSAPIKLKDMGEINMGDHRILLDFLEYSKTNYSADRYILSIYDHGLGWAGACSDETDSGWLKMDEMQWALKKANGVDLIFFSAPCRMGAVESVYELRDCTDVYIGSENASGYCFWRDAMGNIRETLHKNPDIDTYELGEKVIEYIFEKSLLLEQIEKIALTMSAIRTDKIIELKDAIDAVSSEYSGNFQSFSSHIDSLYKDIRKYVQFSIDIYDFAEKLLTIEEDPQIRTKLEQVMVYLKDAVIAECHGEAMKGSHGLSIYFPDKRGGQKYYDMYGSSDYGLDFSADTSWDEVLAAYFGAGNSVMAETGGEFPPSPFSQIGGKYLDQR